MPYSPSPFGRRGTQGDEGGRGKLRIRNCELRVGVGVALGTVVRGTQMDADEGDGRRWIHRLHRFPPIFCVGARRALPCPLPCPLWLRVSPSAASLVSPEDEAVEAERCSALRRTRSHRGHGGGAGQGTALPLRKKSAVIGANRWIYLRPSAFCPHPPLSPFSQRAKGDRARHASPLQKKSAHIGAIGGFICVHLPPSACICVPLSSPWVPPSPFAGEGGRPGLTNRRWCRGLLRARRRPRRWEVRVRASSIPAGGRPLA